MSDWTRDADNPNVYTFGGKYTLRRAYLVWELYATVLNLDTFPIIQPSEQLSAEERQDLVDALEELQTNPKGIVIPKDWDVQIHTTAIAHTHVKPTHYSAPGIDVPKHWAEVVINMHEAECASKTVEDE